MERDHFGRLEGVARRVERIARELSKLHPEIDGWDGLHPPVQHLTERLESVEADLRKLESEVQALSRRDGSG